MTNIDIQALLPVFGYSIETPDVISVLAKYGFSTDLPLAKLRKAGSHNIVDKARGLEIMFMERAQFQSLYGEPKSTGEGILVSLAVHPQGKKDFKPFMGSLGSFLDGVTSFVQIGKKLGRGRVEDEADGIVYTESWNLDGTALFVDYADDGSLLTLQFSSPMLDI
jgi:hypothetical protein